MRLIKDLPVITSRRILPAICGPEACEKIGVCTKVVMWDNEVIGGVLDLSPNWAWIEQWVIPLDQSGMKLTKEMEMLV